MDKMMAKNFKSIFAVLFFLVIALGAMAQADSITYEVKDNEVLEQTTVTVFRKEDLVKELQLMYAQQQQIVKAFEELKARIVEKEKLINQFPKPKTAETKTKKEDGKE